MSHSAKNKQIALALEEAMESIRKCRWMLGDEEDKALLYHAGMTLRTLQKKYDTSEHNLRGH